MDKYESAKILWKYGMEHPACYPCMLDWGKVGLNKSDHLFDFAHEHAKNIRKHARGEFGKNTV